MEHLQIQWEKVLILGNRSYKNMGDELILLGTIRLLQAQGKKILISAYDPTWLKGFFAQFENMEDITYISEFPKWIRSGLKYFFSSSIRELSLYRSADAVIIWWGEILTEESKDAYRYWNLGLAPLIWKLRSKKRGYGVSVYLMWGVQTPLKKLNISYFRWLLSHTKYAYLRDEESVQALKNFWFENVEFFMDTSWEAYPWESIKKTETTSKTALINLNKNGERFFDDLLEECKNLLQDWYMLKYVSVSKGRSSVYDDEYYKKQLENRLGIPLESIDREPDFWAFVQEVKNADLVVTARLHLFLIASYLWVETKVFPYQKKILKMQKMREKKNSTLKNQR